MQTFGAFFDLRLVSYELQLFLFSWFAPHLEIFRGVGVIGYYVAKLWDKDGILPNRIFMIGFFGLSTILWTVYAIRGVSFLKVLIDFHFEFSILQTAK
jgi:hypothetical protein